MPRWIVRQVSEYLRAHPLFSKTELSDPRTLSAPDVPTSIRTKYDLKKWEGDMGLKSGGYFKTPDGSYKKIP
jgi:hypothetical protein